MPGITNEEYKKLFDDKKLDANAVVYAFAHQITALNNTIEYYRKLEDGQAVELAEGYLDLLTELVEEAVMIHKTKPKT